MAKKGKGNGDGAVLDEVRRVTLNDEQKARKGELLAEKLGYIAAIRAQMKADEKRHRELIDQALEEAEAIRIEILEGEEEKRQAQLFAGDQVAGGGDGSAQRITDETAKNVLAEVARRAGDGPAPAEPARGSAYDFTGEEPVPAPVSANAEVAAAGRGQAPTPEPAA